MKDIDHHWDGFFRYKESWIGETYGSGYMKSIDQAVIETMGTKVENPQRWNYDRKLMVEKVFNSYKQL